ncbi:uncharacterized protein LOC143581605 [Bidens hawaiensis]|uniref:uncharacterized protein LOC143581605 n=1 Tax=Bidens hawaiensis TaxID=980011 RepID=UPI00404A8B3A
MPFPDSEYISIASNSLIHEDLSYDQNQLKVEFQTLFNSITHEKKNVFDRIIMTFQQNKGGFFFVYGYGGTGIYEAQLLEKTKLIIWDEAPMAHKHEFQALDMSLKDVLSSNFLFGGKVINYENQHYFQDRAILAPTNEIVDEINDSLLKFFPGDEVEYLSSDIICKSEYINDTADTALYSPELLNGLRISGLPNHKLVLKVGVPIMLLRNLNRKEGLCNGTRLQIISLGTRVVDAKIISGANIRHRVLIHRSPLTPTDNKIAYKFQRRQFPLAVYFAMTINKRLGQ